MDKRFLDHYNRELRYLQSAALEFSREFPGVAGHLGLDKVPCPDPYVERLLEGSAFLAARVQARIDAGFPRFTQSLLEAIYPHFLAPTPSMAVVRFEPDMSDKDLKKGHPVPRHTILRSIAPRSNIPGCTFRTAHAVTLLPIKVSEAHYLRREISTLELADIPPDTKAAVRIRLEPAPGIVFASKDTPPDSQPDELTFYLGGADTVAMRLYEQLLANVLRVDVRIGRRNEDRLAEGACVLRLAPTCIQRVGMTTDESMLPYDSRSFHGYRLLHEYFALPERFMFVRMAGLRDAFTKWEKGGLEFIITLAKADPLLEATARDAEAFASMFQLFCTPAVNIFPKQADHILVRPDAYEYTVIPDRARSMDFEVYRIERVLGYSTRSSAETTFSPFYRAREEDDVTSAFYSTFRTARGGDDKSARSTRRTSYAGSDVAISLVDSRAAPFEGSLNRVAVDTLCTNRDLPLFFEKRPPDQTDFTLEIGSPILRTHCVSGPSKPWPSAAEGETLWRLVSHMGLNYVSLMEGEDGTGASGLREMMRLYSAWTESQVRADVTMREQVRKQVESLTRIDRQGVTERLPRPGPITYARGIELTVTFDETGFEGSGAFLLGSILDHFFARFVSLNSFTRTTIRTIQRGELIRWPSTLGQRPLL